MGSDGIGLVTCRHVIQLISQSIVFMIGSEKFKDQENTVRVSVCVVQYGTVQYTTVQYSTVRAL